jgi:hypothetical protein
LTSAFLLLTLLHGFLVLELVVQDFTGGGTYTLRTSYSSSGNPEFDRRIQEMVSDWGVRESRDLIVKRQRGKQAHRWSMSRA